MRRLRNIRQEQAIEDPEALSQETIVAKLDPKEWERLSRVRNIGIAVSYLYSKDILVTCLI